MRHFVLCVLVAFVLLSSSISASAQPAPSVSAEVVFTQVYANSDTVRFLAYIRNPHEYTVGGVTTRWEAYDADGVIVGSRTKTQPPILGGMDFPYVGGAGGAILSGRPAAVAIFLESLGERTDALPRIFPVEGVTLAPGGTRSRPTPNEYDVTATVTIDSEPINRRDLSASIILRDRAGVVVGADFADFLHAPDVLAPGARVRVDERMDTVAPATTGEVFAYADRP